jgi:hypothetical protein
MKAKLAVVLVAVGCAATARAAEKIRYEEIAAKFAPLHREIEHREITVTTLDSVKHTGRRLYFFADHVRLYRTDDSWAHRSDDSSEDLPSDEIARIEINQRGRFFHHIVEDGMAALLPIPVALAACGNGDCGVGMVIYFLATPPLLAYAAASTPVFLAADAAAFFIPPKVYEIVH